MARVARNRSRTNTWVGVSGKTYFGSTWISGGATQTQTRFDSCADSHGRPVIDSTFSSDQWDGTYPHLDGTVIPSNRTSNSSTVYDGSQYSGIPTALAGLVNPAGPNGWMLDLVAGTNPSRPVTNIPIWAQNIAELPKMVKQLGDLLKKPSGAANPKGAASTYLGYSFGWSPLIDDLSKLLDFQSYVNKRNKELNQLYLGKGLRRRITLNSDSSNVNIRSQTATYANAIIVVDDSLAIQSEQWATIHWKPTTPPSYHPQDEELNSLSKQLVLGLTPEGIAKGVWDVIPWTWLLGWFTNLGKYTLAHSWTVPADHSGGCLMRKCTGTWSANGCTVSAALSSSVTASGSLTRTLRGRSLGTAVTVGANMPYLDMWRLSILGSLYVQRFF
jgi:hypothetical protein